MKIFVSTLFCLLFFTVSVQALTVNDQAPTFSLRDSRDNYFFLSDYLGPQSKQPAKGFIISFFASYCQPCRYELPVLNSLTPEFAKKGVKVILVGVEDFEMFEPLLVKLKVDQPIILSDPYRKVKDKYGVQFLPTTFFIGADGKVKSVLRGEVKNIGEVLTSGVDYLLAGP